MQGDEAARVPAEEEDGRDREERPLSGTRGGSPQRQGGRTEQARRQGADGEAGADDRPEAAEGLVCGEDLARARVEEALEVFRRGRAGRLGVLRGGRRGRRSGDDRASLRLVHGLQPAPLQEEPGDGHQGGEGGDPHQEAVLEAAQRDAQGGEEEPGHGRAQAEPEARERERLGQPVEPVQLVAQARRVARPVDEDLADGFGGCSEGRMAVSVSLVMGVSLLRVGAASTRLAGAHVEDEGRVDVLARHVGDVAAAARRREFREAEVVAVAVAYAEVAHRLGHRVGGLLDRRLAARQVRDGNGEREAEHVSHGFSILPVFARKPAATVASNGHPVKDEKGAPVDVGKQTRSRRRVKKFAILAKLLLGVRRIAKFAIAC